MVIVWRTKRKIRPGEGTPCGAGRHWVALNGISLHSSLFLIKQDSDPHCRFKRTFRKHKSINSCASQAPVRRQAHQTGCHFIFAQVSNISSLQTLKCVEIFNLFSCLQLFKAFIWVGFLARDARGLQTQHTTSISNTIGHRERKQHRLEDLSDFGLAYDLNFKCLTKMTSKRYQC